MYRDKTKPRIICGAFNLRRKKLAKQDLTILSEDEQMKRVHNYIKQRSFHKDQNNKIGADDLTKAFKHQKFSNGAKRIKFFNRLLMQTVNKFAGVNKEYEKVKIVVQRI